jgi:hypothetical protein
MAVPAMLGHGRDARGTKSSGLAQRLFSISAAETGRRPVPSGSQNPKTRSRRQPTSRVKTREQSGRLNINRKRGVCPPRAVPPRLPAGSVIMNRWRFIHASSADPLTVDHFRGIT